MLKKVLNIKWPVKINNKALYGDLKTASETIRERRMRLAGHVFRDDRSPAHQIVIWLPLHGAPNRGRPDTTLVDTLLRDSNMVTVADLETSMKNKDRWHLLSASRCPDIDQKKKKIPYFLAQNSHL